MSENSEISQAGYESVRQSTNEGMGGGVGAHGSGVAGGYEGNQGQATQSQGQAGATGEKADWLDKGLTSIGKKFGMNVSQSNADKAGDFANKEAKQYGGRNIPGVQ